MIKSWHDVCPKEFQKEVSELISQLKIDVRIAKPRKTKFGDFRVEERKKPVISINNDLGKDHGCLTFFHELAHAFVYRKYRRSVQPHGKEWKAVYKNCIQNVLRYNYFEPEIESAVKSHIANIKSSTCYDAELMRLFLPEKDVEGILLSELEPGNVFKLNGHVFKLGMKRRTRFLCERLSDEKQFTISVNAVVETDNILVDL